MGNQVDATVSTEWSDLQYDTGCVSYKVTTVDMAGNESDRRIGVTTHAVLAIRSQGKEERYSPAGVGDGVIPAV